jgi:hypothetical protein
MSTGDDRLSPAHRPTLTPRDWACIRDLVRHGSPIGYRNINDAMSDGLRINRDRCYGWRHTDPDERALRKQGRPNGPRLRIEELSHKLWDYGT